MANYELNTSACYIIDLGKYNSILGEYDIPDKSVLNYAEDFIKKQVELTPGVEFVEMVDYYHPKYYNYETDSASFIVSIDGRVLDKLIEKYSNDSRFIQFLKNYASGSGFISNFASTKDEFLEQRPVKSLAQIIKYNADDVSEVTASFLDEIVGNFERYDDDEFEESFKTRRKLKKTSK